MNNYELAKIDYSSGLSTKEIADKYNVTVATVRKWKSRYNWESVTKKRDKSVTSKKGKEVAKILVEEGHTLKEASALSGTSIDTLKKISSKEKLQQSQLEYLKSFRDEYRQKIRKNKLKRLLLNNKNLEKLSCEIENSEETSKADFEKLKLSEEIEQLIFECDRIERLEKMILESEIKKTDLEMKKIDLGVKKETEKLYK